MKAVINWCEKVVPPLFAFNRMFKLRNGNVPIQIIELRGTEDDIAYTVDMETEALYSEGLIENSSPITDIGDTNTPQLYFLDSVDGIVPTLGNIYFVKECHASIKHNTFDVSGSYAPGRFDYKELISLLGFDNLTNESIWALPFELILQHKVKADIADVANKTMLCHFERTGNNKFEPSDFNWIKTEDKTIIPEAPAPVKNNSNQTIVSDEKTNIEIKMNRVNLQDKSAMIQKTSFQQMIKNAGIDPKTVAAFEEANRIVDVDEKTTNTAVKVNENSHMIIKESLTQEEKESNQVALENIKVVYQDCINFINSLANSQYTMIRNVMRECLQKTQFNQQFTRMYLEISDDTSTPIYEQLYNLDVATAAYQRELVHQAVHLGCVYCNHEWDEDITFMTAGPHLIQCPKCYGDRPFEKED